MCGRFVLAASESYLKEYFGLSKSFVMRPRYNIAPMGAIPVIQDLRGEINFFKWGLIPYWMSSSLSTPIKGYINARAETLFEKPAFKKAISRQRCIIPATGYYEWMALKGKKIPYYISVNPFSKESNTLFGMAGIWDTWQDENGLRQETCAIITVAAPEAITHLSDRMPLILSLDHHKTWLSKKVEVLDLQSILNFPSHHTYYFHPVSPRMNNPSFDGPQCLEPL